MALSRCRTRVLVALVPCFIGSALVAQPQKEGLAFRLTRDSVVAGVRCGPTGKARVVLHDNGALDECPLALDSAIAGHTLPAGTWLRLLPDGRLDGVWLSRDTRLAGLPCKGTGYKGWAVRFHPDERLKLCYLSQDFTVDGVPCRGAGFRAEMTGSTQVTLSPQGKLLSCRLSRNYLHGGVEWKRGQRIRITPS